MNFVIRVARRIANSPQLLLATFFGTIATSAVLYMIAEDTSLLNAIYWSLVTATTLGYGDFSPHTTFGKILASGLVTFTIFVMLPTITANVAAWLIVNRDAFTDEEQEEIKDELRELVALLKKDEERSQSD